MDAIYSLVKPTRYAALSQDSQTSDSMEKLLPAESEQQNVETGVMLTWRRAACLLVAWLLTSLAASLWLNALMNPQRLNGIELKRLEFKPTESWIEEEIVKFTGAPIFEPGKVAYREYVPGIKQYIGNTTDVHNAWEELLHDRYFLIDEDEARAIFPDNYQDYYHTALGWWIGLDGFHILHCINVVRRSLMELRAGKLDQSSFKVYHEDHCIDLIRQSVQCNMDLTPVPERRWAEVEHFIDSNQEHVCRNVWTLREFLNMRQEKTNKLIKDYEAKTGKKFVEAESAMGVFGFPERKGHEQDYRPPYMREPEKST